MSMLVLNADEIARFNEQGFLKKDFGLDHRLLDTIVERLKDHYDPEHIAGRHPGTRMQDAWLQIEEVRHLAVDRRILAALQQLYGRQPLPFQTLNFPFGTEQRPHSDTIHFNSIPRGFMAGVWVALEDIDEENGPLIYYPGSHSLPEYTMQDLGLKPGYEHYPEYEEKIDRVIHERGLQAQLGTMPKGTTLIWHANLLHGGARQGDKARTRHSQVIHVFFADCKYYTPMNSRSWLRSYRKPRWIPRHPAVQGASS